MSYSTPIPPLVPFSPSGRRPHSQPLSSDENKTELSAKNNYESLTERDRSIGKQNSILPPLISALDTYIESSVEAKADSIIFQLNERSRQDSNIDDSSMAKKKKKKVKSMGKKTKISTLQEAAKLAKALVSSPTADGNPSIYSATDSVYSLNQTNDILNPGEYAFRSLSDSSKDTDISSNQAASPRAILASKYLSSPSKNSSDFDMMSYAVAKKPASHPITSSSASKAINNRNIRMAALPESPSILNPVDTANRFNKAIESIAALRLHNYALRRREQMSQKIKLLKEIRQYERENNREYVSAQQIQEKQLLAAWKIRFYVEFLRFNTMKHIVSIVEDKNAELLQDNSQLSQYIQELETNKTVTTARTNYIDDLTAEVSSLKKSLSDKNAELAAKEQQLQDLEKQFESTGNELHITKLTCQDLVKSMAKSDGMLASIKAEFSVLREDKLASDSVRESKEQTLQKQLETLQMRNEDLLLHSAAAVELDNVLQRIIYDNDLLNETLLMQDEDNMQARIRKSEATDKLRRQQEMLEAAKKTKDGLQIIVSDLATKVATAVDTEQKLQAAAAESEKKMKKLRKQIKEQDAQIADMEDKIQSSMEEVEFLVDENGELAREIEILTMYAEDVRTKYGLSVDSANNSAGYSRYLEEQLFAARKKERHNIFGGSASILSAGDLFADVSGGESYDYLVPGTGNADYGGRDALKVGFDEDEISMHPSHEEVNFDSPSQFQSPGSQIVVQLAEIGRSGRRANDLIDTKKLADSSFNAINGGSSIMEAKMIFLMNSLEEKMKTVDNAAESLRFLAEKADAIDRVQTLAALSLIDKANINQSTLLTAEGEDFSMNSRISQHLQSSAIDPLMGSIASAGHGKDPYISKHQALLQTYLQAKIALDEANQSLLTQRAEMTTLSERRSYLKKLISSWRKKYKKAHTGAEPTEETVASSEIADIVKELEAVMNKMTANKVLNLEINSRATAMQSGMITASVNMQDNAKEFLLIFGEPLSNYVQFPGSIDGSSRQSRPSTDRLDGLSQEISMLTSDATGSIITFTFDDDKKDPSIFAVMESNDAIAFMEVDAKNNTTDRLEYVIDTAQQNDVSSSRSPLLFSQPLEDDTQIGRKVSFVDTTVVPSVHIEESNILQSEQSPVGDINNEGPINEDVHLDQQPLQLQALNSTDGFISPPSTFSEHPVAIKVESEDHNQQIAGVKRTTSGDFPEHKDDSIVQSPQLELEYSPTPGKGSQTSFRAFGNESSLEKSISSESVEHKDSLTVEVGGVAIVTVEHVVETEDRTTLKSGNIDMELTIPSIEKKEDIIESTSVIFFPKTEPIVATRSAPIVITQQKSLTETASDDQQLRPPILVVTEPVEALKIVENTALEEGKESLSINIECHEAAISTTVDSEVNTTFSQNNEAEAEATSLSVSEPVPNMNESIKLEPVSVKNLLDRQCGFLVIDSVQCYNISPAAKALVDRSDSFLLAQLGSEVSQRSSSVVNIGSKVIFNSSTTGFPVNKRRLEEDLLNIKIVDESSFAAVTTICQGTLPIVSMLDAAEANEVFKISLPLLNRKGKPAGNAVLSLRIEDRELSSDQLIYLEALDSHSITTNTRQNLQSADSALSSEEEDVMASRPNSAKTLSESRLFSRTGSNEGNKPFAVLQVRKIKVVGLSGDEIEPFIRLSTSTTGWVQRTKSIGNTKRSAQWSALDFTVNIPVNALKREKLYLSLVEDAIIDPSNKSALMPGIIMASTSVSLRKLFSRKNKWVDLKLSLEGPDGAVKEGMFVSLTASLTMDDSSVLSVNAGMSSPHSSESEMSPTIPDRYSPVGFASTIANDVLKGEMNRSISLDGAAQESEKTRAVSPVSSAARRISSANPLQMFSIPEETSVDVPSPKEEEKQTSVTESIMGVLSSRTKRSGKYSCGLRSEAHSNRQQQNIEKQLERERTALRNCELQTQVAKLHGEMELMTSTLLSTMETVEILKQTRSDVAKEIVEWNETFYALCGFQPDVNDKKKSAVFTALGQAYLDVQHALKIAYDDALKILSLAKPKYDELQKAQQELQETSTNFYHQKVPSMDINLNITDPYDVENASLTEIIAESVNNETEKSVTLLDSLSQYTSHSERSHSTNKGGSFLFKTSAKSSTGTVSTETKLGADSFLSAMFMGNALDVMKRQTTPERRVSSAFIGNLISNFSPPRSAISSGIATNSSRPVTPERRLSTMLIGDIFAIAAAPSTDKLKNLNSQRLLQQQQQQPQQNTEKSQRAVTPPQRMSMLFVDNIMRSVTPPSAPLSGSEQPRNASPGFISDIIFNSIVRAATPPPTHATSVPYSTATEIVAPSAQRPANSSPLRARIDGKSTETFSTDAMGNLVREKKQSPSPALAKFKKSPYVNDPVVVAKKPVSAYKTDSMGNLIPTNKSSQQAKSASSSPSQVASKFDVMGNLIPSSSSSKSPQSNSRKGISNSPSQTTAKPTANVKNEDFSAGSMSTTNRTSTKSLTKAKSSSTKLKEKEKEKEKDEQSLSSKKSPVQVSTDSALSRSSSVSSSSGSPRQQTQKAVSTKAPHQFSSSDLNDKTTSKVTNTASMPSPNNQVVSSKPTENVIHAQVSPKVDDSSVQSPIGSQEDAFYSGIREAAQSPPVDISLSSIREEDAFGSLDGSSIVSTSDTESLASISTGASSSYPKEKEYKQLKKDLRKWKAEFSASYGRDPVASDFPNIDNEIKEKISRKNQLSKELEDSRAKRSKLKY